MEFEWNIFPGFNTLQLSEEVKRLLLRSDETPENFTGRIIFMSMFNDISCGSRDNEKECLANAKLVSQYARRFGKGQLSFIGLGSEKKWYCISEDSPQGVWDNVAERMLVEFAESGCPIFRATSPLSRGQLKSKEHGKLSIHYAADLGTVETVFRTMISVNQIEKLSQHDKLSKFCTDAGFLNVVEIGQYFRTKDTADLSQFHAVACCRDTLFQEKKKHNQKDGSKGTQRLAPY